MPVYNDADLVGSAIASLQEQTFGDFELIISDNASTDGTSKTCLAAAERDPRIRYFRHETNGGQAANFEFTLTESRGEFFAWACSDDAWDSRFIERLLSALEAAPEAIGSFGPFAMTDKGGKINETRNFDYSGSWPLQRLYALCWHWDDGHEYGLFRRERLRGLSFPKWWGPNRPSPYDISYPVLFFILARGEIVSVDGAPLLLKRRRGGAFHYQAGGANIVTWYLCKLLLSLNLLLFALVWTRRGGHSLPLSLGVLPPVAARVASLSLAPLPGLIRYGLSRTVRVVFGESGLATLRRVLLKK